MDSTVYEMTKPTFVRCSLSPANENRRQAAINARIAAHRITVALDFAGAVRLAA
jgi:hypothetical protein